MGYSMPKAKRITDERVEDAIKFLLGLRPKVGLRQEEVAKKMAPSIRRAMRMGYSLKEIQAIISKELGINIQLSKLQKAVDGNETETDTAKTPMPDGGQAIEQQATPPKKEEASTPPQKGCEVPATGETAESTETSKDTPPPTEDGKAGPQDITNAEDSEATEEGEDTAPVCVPFRVDLTTDKSEKEEVRALGAKWDYPNFTWYVEPNKDLRPFEKWLKYELAEYQADAANNTRLCASEHSAEGVL